MVTTASVLGHVMTAVAGCRPCSYSIYGEADFVSYGREVQAFVVKLKCDSEKYGFTVWLDMEDIYTSR